jgi:glycine cleavage system aminomethyltransferase T
VRDFDWISRHIKPDEHAVLTDVSPLYSVLSVMGPEGARTAGPRQPDDLSPEALKFSWTRD